MIVPALLQLLQQVLVMVVAQRRQHSLLDVHHKRVLVPATAAGGGQRRCNPTGSQRAERAAPPGGSRCRRQVKCLGRQACVGKKRLVSSLLQPATWRERNPAALRGAAASPPCIQLLRVIVRRLLGAHVVDGGVCGAYKLRRAGCLSVITGWNGQVAREIAEGARLAQGEITSAAAAPPCKRLPRCPAAMRRRAPQQFLIDFKGALMYCSSPVRAQSRCTHTASCSALQ